MPLQSFLLERSWLLQPLDLSHHLRCLISWQPPLWQSYLLEDVLCHDTSVTRTLMQAMCDAAIMIWAGWEVATGEAWAEAWEAWEAWAEAWVEVA